MPPSPRVLYLDIETAPNLAYVWGHYEQNVIEHLREWYILCACWKWEGEKKVHAVAQIDDAARFAKDPIDDTHVLLRLWDLLDEADVVIAHNGDRFDIPKIQARFMIAGMMPTSPFQTLDTRRIAARYAKFNSNSLDNLGQTLGLGRKVKHEGFEMWLGCMSGQKQWWNKMIRYNRQDVELLQKVYLLLRPWVSNHPVLFVDGCHACGSDRLQSRGPRRTHAYTYHRKLCLDCGTWNKVYTSDRTAQKPEHRGDTRK